MTPEEYERWKRVTNKSVGHWMLDEVTFHNKKEYLFFKGGENGKYINIKTDGMIFFGSYEGAIPHIAEAIFTIEGRAKFESKGQALAKLVSVGGMSVLLPLF